MRNLLVFSWCAVAIGVLGAPWGARGAAAPPNFDQGPLVGPGQSFDSELVTWQQAMSLTRLPVPPAACLDLFERIDGLLEELFVEPSYQEALRRLDQSLLPALVRLMERAQCEPDLCMAPEETVYCRALREEARAEAEAFEALPASQRLLRARTSRTYLTLVHIGLTQRCFAPPPQSAVATQPLAR